VTIEIVVTDTLDRDDTDDDYHLIPFYEVENHEPTRRCWCQPRIEIRADCILVEHRERN